MIAVGAALEDSVDVAAAIAPLGGVIERGLNLEFLHDVWVRQWRVGQFHAVVAGDADALDRTNVFVLTLAVYLDANLPTPQMGCCIQFTLGPGSEGEQLLKILRRQR